MQYSQVAARTIAPKISGQKPVIEKPGVKAAVTASTTAPTTSLMRKVDQANTLCPGIVEICHQFTSFLFIVDIALH